MLERFGGKDFMIKAKAHSKVAILIESQCPSSKYVCWWIEHSYQCDGILTKTVFWVKERYHDRTWVPAMFGRHVGSHHYAYEISERRYASMENVEENLRFETRRQVFEWLSQIIVQAPDRWDYFTITIQQNQQGQAIE